MVSIIAHQILPLFGIEKGDFLAFKVVVCAGVGGILYEHFRPTPLSLPRGENWSLQVKEAGYKVFQGKRRYLDQMAACLKQRRKVLVLGPSGVGKTETVRSFVKAVHRGDYPELQGKTFFYFNAADLQNETRKENILSWIKQKVGMHQEDIVIIFDEIHTVCRGVFADQLKTTLDRCFPYFIGITTDKEYQEFIEEKQGALGRRFEKVDIEAPTEEDLLERILPNVIRSEMPEVLIENPRETLQYLIDQTQSKLKIKGAPLGVDHTIEVLRCCFLLTSDGQSTKVDETLVELKEKIERYHSLKTIDNRFFSEGNEITQLRSSLLDREKEIIDQEKLKKTFFKERQELFRMKRKCYALALRVETLSAKERLIFHLIHQILYPAAAAALKDRAHTLQVKTVINKKLIDEAVHKLSYGEKR